jgi:hypothetical protein
MTSRDYVFFSISQLGIDDLKDFMSSLRFSHTACNVVCFYGDTDPDTLQWLQEQGVIVVPMKEYLFKIPFVQRKLNPLKWFYPVVHLYWQLFVNKKTNAVRTGSAYRFVKALSRICTMRFFYYFEYLSDHIQEIDRVILTDVRDVLFLDSPFRESWSEGVHMFLEGDGHTIESNKWNKYWIQKIGGDALLGEIGSKPISCAGVTYANSAEMLEYLHLMCTLLSTTIDRLDLDQGFHNVILWRSMLPNLRAGRCGHSEVLTMGLYPDEQVKFDDRGRLLNTDGSVVKIVHQYDRKSSVAGKLLQTVFGHTTQ